MGQSSSQSAVPLRRRQAGVELGLAGSRGAPALLGCYSLKGSFGSHHAMLCLSGVLPALREKLDRRA